MLDQITLQIESLQNELENTKKQVEKLQFFVSLIADTIDYKSHPIELLILRMGWSEEQFEKAHDIFEKYSKLLESNEAIDWRNEFEFDLREEFKIGYQTVKSIVLAFWMNHQWSEVCVGYAKSFEPGIPVELKRILEDEEGYS